MEKTAEQRLQERLEQILSQKEAPSSAFMAFSKLASTQLDDPTEEVETEEEEEEEEQALEAEEGSVESAPVAETTEVKVAGMDTATLASTAVHAILSKIASDNFELSVLKGLYGDVLVNKTAAPTKKA